MESNKITPEKSFEIITQIINEAKLKFEENGFIYVFWGVLISIASISQFILLKNEYYDINYYPYFLMPIGGIYTGYYFFKKNKNKHNQISKIVSISWITISLNIMILGFVFAVVLKEHLTPVILILAGIGTIISGGSIKNKLIIYSGLVINISGILCFKLEWIYHSLLMGIISIIALLIPGIILMIEHKKKQNV